MKANDPVDSEQDFERDADLGSQSLIGDFLAYLKYTRKWWVTPIVLFLTLFALLIFLGGTGAAPFIYTLF